ncbi:MAG TPA: RES domain-containing protein [Jatrophihabitantaceae bacterium]|jgi:hypothetical protein|nr:RES domain-containing protein [Jatrophihabitantaceae bacterium]
MPSLYRVLPYLASARPRTPGHPSYAPRSTGRNRVDNPGLYEVLYLGDTAAGAIAEAFGNQRSWDAGLFRGIPTLAGSMRALVTYEFDEVAHVCDMDDAARLTELELRPSQVVTRERTVTQGWAARVFEQGRFAGVRWWSYYDPRWGSYGLWDTTALRVAGAEVLDSVDHPAFVEAADVLCRVVQR